MEHWNLQASIDPRQYLQRKSAKKKKQRGKQDAFEDTVKPLYNGPVYYVHLAIPQGRPLYTGLTVNSTEVCEAHSQSFLEDSLTLITS